MRDRANREAWDAAYWAKQAVPALRAAVGSTLGVLATDVGLPQGARAAAVSGGTSLVTVKLKVLAVLPGGHELPGREGSVLKLLEDERRRRGVPGEDLDSVLHDVPITAVPFEAQYMAHAAQLMARATATDAVAEPEPEPGLVSVTLGLK